MTAAPDGAVLLLTAWLDEGALRVRLTAADDLAGPSRPVGVAAGVDDACHTVRRWLQDVAARGCEDLGGGRTDPGDPG